jgi:hypothetical protein
MRDNHGERITARELIEFVEKFYADDEELLIMVGGGDDSGDPPAAALMSWDAETGKPEPTALNVPVFTLMPDFFRQSNAPIVVDGRQWKTREHWDVNKIGSPDHVLMRLAEHAERTARAFPGLFDEAPPAAVEVHPGNEIPG